MHICLNFCFNSYSLAKKTPVSFNASANKPVCSAIFIELIKYAGKLKFFCQIADKFSPSFKPIIVFSIKFFIFLSRKLFLTIFKASIISIPDSKIIDNCWQSKITCLLVIFSSFPMLFIYSFIL